MCKEYSLIALHYTVITVLDIHLAIVVFLYPKTSAASRTSFHIKLIMTRPLHNSNIFQSHEKTQLAHSHFYNRKKQNIQKQNTFYEKLIS